MSRSKLIRAATTVLTLALAVALCASALSLYAEGQARRAAGSGTEPIFTRGEIAVRLGHIAPLALLWLLGLVGAAALGRSPHPEDARAMRQAPVPRESGTPRILRVALYAAAALLLAMGVLNGGLNDVFVKAANICTECIGLG